MGPKSKACVACRVAKRTCIHNDRPPCKRCKDRGDECFFPPPGTSNLHRQPRGLRPGRQRIDVKEMSASPGAGGHGSFGGHTLVGRDDGREGSVAGGRGRAGDGEGEGVDLSRRDPFKLFTDEVKNSYLRCSYKWCFHHIPTLLDKVRKGTLEGSLIWAILALAIRFTSDPPSPFETPLEASNAFAAHARSIILQDMEQPTVSRIQTLLMITGHSWGAGEGRRAWMFLGMAVRGAQVIGLFQESGPAPTREEYILAEERRRTAWTCFLMDSLLSGGKGRRRSLAAEDMQIQLPCDTGYFYFGEPVRCRRMNETEEDLRAVRMASQGRLDIGNIGIVGYTMQVADTWGAVARWACSTTDDLPWERASEYQTLMRALERWRTSLPSRLAYSVSSLHAHSASDQGQAFCYMHSVYFMCLMFLNRSYLQSLPEVEPRKRAPAGSELERHWHQWELQSKKELLAVANQVCEMLYEMRNFGLFFLRGLVPWIGFTAYTATGIMLYYYHFPDQNEKSNAMSQARDHVVQGCMFLKDMKGSWPMADTWRETIKQMQIYYSNIKTKGEQSITQNERREMRNAIVDYGALQPSPVHSSSENEGGPAAGLLGKLKLQYITSATSSPPAPPMPNAATVQTPVTLPSLQNSPLSHNPNSPMPSHQQNSPMPHIQQQQQQQQNHHHHQSPMSHNHHSAMPCKRSPSPTGESPNMGQQQQQQQMMITGQASSGYQTLEMDFLSPGFDLFEMDFNINDGDLESAIADAAQGFWNDFPGEVEVL